MIGLRRRPRSLGERGEALAAKKLKRAGYRILDRNVQLGRFEIDIIAREGDTIAFVEVKTRTSDDVAIPEDNITPKKRKHIVSAARAYQARHDDPRAYYRFDVVAVLIPAQGKPAVTIHRDAFREDSA